MAEMVKASQSSVSLVPDPSFLPERAKSEASEEEGSDYPSA